LALARSGLAVANFELGATSSARTSTTLRRSPSGVSHERIRNRPITMARAPLGPGQVRLCLGSLAHGDGPTLQDAADDRVQRLLTYALAFRASGMRSPLDLGPPDLATMNFLYELGEIAAAGGDIRRRLFG
jgi:hypothetical protein